MTTIQLNEAQLAQFTATGLIVVDGEPCWYHKAGRTLIRSGPRCDCGKVAPELWRKLTDPCPTCDGTGNDPAYYSAPHVFPCPNPDCADGRQVVTLTSTCTQCDGYGEDGRMLERWPCGECATTGLVTLGRFTTRLLPCTEGWPWAQDVPGLDPLPQPGQWAVQFEAVE